ncbi:MAG: MBL fold metallo-hydrolase [Flavobacteriales bacterium]|jgi:hydroxyacylglutathione hydrolase
MLNVKKFTFNPFLENTYVVTDEFKNAVIIDPGCYYKAEQNELDSYVLKNNLKLKSILHTHSHLDHMFGTAYLADKYNLDLWICKEDLVTYQSYEKVCEVYGVPITFSPNPTPKFFDLKQLIQIDGIKFEILYVPGHSPGHVAFYNKENNFLINGDCLFENSIGRTDLPGGNHQQLIDSIKNEIFILPDETLVYCGHGNETTIKAEKSFNPFLR